MREEEVCDEERQCQMTCVEPGKDLRIIDPCEGEIVDLDGCTRQARQIVDSEMCARLCEKGKLPGSETDCSAVCSRSMGTPWYAQDAFKDGNGRWVFPRLNTLFDGADTLGVQAGYVRRAQLDTTLDKRESAAEVSTTSALTTWHNDIARQASHAAKPVDYTQDPDSPLAVTRTDQPITSTKGEPSTTTWTTPWP